MKAVIACALALNLLSVAHATGDGIIVNGFSDNACATQSATTIDGVTYPLVCKFNACCPFLKFPNSGAGAQTYLKATACDGKTYSLGFAYQENTCAGASSPLGQNPGICIDIGSYNIAGLKSIKITCASASSATLALLSVAAAAIAFCM
jgi:hypothetical protein